METKTEIHRTDKSKGEIKMSFYQLGFYSKILEKDTDVLVAAPEKLDTDCKVVYLLHGGGGGPLPVAAPAGTAAGSGGVGADPLAGAAGKPEPLHPAAVFRFGAGQPPWSR